MHRPFAINSRHPIRPACGFTLLECLAVLAIIGLLAGILIPVLGNVRQSSRTAASLTNLRSIGQGLLQHAGDKRNRLPTLTGAKNVFQHDYWTAQIEPWLPPPMEWLRPANTPFKRSPAFISPLIANGYHSLYGDYAANQSIIRLDRDFGQGLLVSEVTEPARSVAVFAGARRNSAPLEGSWYIVTWEYLDNPGRSGTVPSGHGAALIPTLFVDGHVEQIAPADFEARRAALLTFPR